MKRNTFFTNEYGQAHWWVISVIVVVVFTAVVSAAMYGYPRYRVYNQTLRGQAILREAEYTRQVAELDAQAEVARAKGVAEANKIIGDSLKGNESYLRYLWIQGLQDGTSEVIYVPTEANLPILEAGRLGAEKVN